MGPGAAKAARAGMTGYVYMMANRRHGTLYTGVTGDLTARVAAHEEGLGSAFAAKWGCTRLVWFAEFFDVRDAVAHEKRVKRWHRAFERDEIEKSNPSWRDLWFDLAGSLPR